MLRYKTETRPGLVALYDIRPGNGAGQFLQPRSPHGACLSVWYLVGARGRRIKEQIPDCAGFKRLLFASIHIVVARSIVIISRCACKCDRGMSVSRSVYVCTPDRNDLKLHSPQHCVAACFYAQKGLGVGTDTSAAEPYMLCMLKHTLFSCVYAKGVFSIHKITTASNCNKRLGCFVLFPGFSSHRTREYIKNNTSLQGRQSPSTLYASPSSS